MNREIKFRVWMDKPVKAMIYQDFRELGEFFDHTVYPLKNKTIQQFTGLKDKNDKEIYEGDIVKYDYNYHYDVDGSSIREVKFRNGSFSPIPVDSLCDDDDFHSYRIKNYEIVGNIFENPDLLK